MFPALIAVFSTFVATVTLFFVSLSVPIIKSIDLFNVGISLGTGSLINARLSAMVDFGVWGFCQSRIESSSLGTGTKAQSSCSTPKLGYKFDSTTAHALQLDRLANVVSETLTTALVLHPIACALAFISFIVTLFALLQRRRHFQKHGTERDGRSRFTSIVAFGVILPAAVLTTVVFFIDVAFVMAARKRLASATDGLVNLTWGGAVWMTLAAAVALWCALVATIAPCGSRLRDRKRRYY